MNRILTLIVSFILTALCCQAQDRGFRHDAEYPFIIISAENQGQAPQISDEEFYTFSTGVVFEVSKTDIRPDDPFFTLYKDQILPRINQQHLQLRKVFVRGAASPEGSYANNRRLGQARSKALLDALRSQLRNQYIETDSEVSSVTEDYGYLCQLMNEANDADYATVQQIYNNCQGNEPRIKQQLMAAQGGRLWQRLLKEYFPKLRSARLILWFSEPDREHAPLSEIAQLKAGPLTFIERPEPQPAPFRYQPQQAETSRRHLLAIRTNLAHDFFYMPQFGWAMSPNIQFEYYPLDGHYTYNIGMTWGNHRHWDSQEFFQVRDFQLELRRYFRGGGDFTGLYAGAYAQGDIYGIGLSATKGWEGEGGGAGLSLGYVMPLNRKGNFRLEFMMAAGFFMTYHDPYVYGNPLTGSIDDKYYYNYQGSASEFKKRNHRFTWLGPTNFGIQLTYDILYRRRKPAR